MPVYEYKCSSCSAKFEIMQKISDEPLTVCSSCGGVLKKMITSTSFVLKGSGWYISDYPSSDRKKSLDSEKPAAEAKEPKTGTSSDTASETKTATGKEAVNT